eukprot:3241339-Amphidinium_carterae.1
MMIHEDKKYPGIGTPRILPNAKLGKDNKKAETNFDSKDPEESDPERAPNTLCGQARLAQVSPWELMLQLQPTAARTGTHIEST